MTVMEEIIELINKINRDGIELPSSILMSREKFNLLNSQCVVNAKYSPGSSSSTVNIFKVHTCFGEFAIDMRHDLPEYHLSIGRMTLDDFLIEDILFDKKTTDTGHTF